MDRIRLSIELREGVTAELLVTPALYSVAKKRGIDLTADVNAGDWVTSYIKTIYCAAISAWEVAAVDDPKRGEFPHKYEDFHAWAWEDRDRFTAVVRSVFQALTGKTLEEATAAGVKKKPGR
jgi:hypothetical protein